jgi:hypothetical protein
LNQPADHDEQTDEQILNTLESFVGHGEAAAIIFQGSTDSRVQTIAAKKTLDGDQQDLLELPIEIGPNIFCNPVAKRISTGKQYVKLFIKMTPHSHR